MMSNLGFGFDNDYYQNMKYFDEDEIETVLVFLEDMADLLVWEFASQTINLLTSNSEALNNSYLQIK